MKKLSIQMHFISSFKNPCVYAAVCYSRGRDDLKSKVDLNKKSVSIFKRLSKVIASFSFVDIMLERARRAKLAQPTAHNAISTVTIPGSNTTVIAIARRSPGTERVISTKKVTILSINPPKYPATDPKHTPKKSAQAVAISPTRRDTLAP